MYGGNVPTDCIDANAFLYLGYDDSENGGIATRHAWEIKKHLDRLENKIDTIGKLVSEIQTQFDNDIAALVTVITDINTQVQALAAELQSRGITDITSLDKLVTSAQTAQSSLDSLSNSPSSSAANTAANGGPTQSESSADPTTGASLQ